VKTTRWYSILLLPVCVMWCCRMQQWWSW